MIELPRGLWRWLSESSRCLTGIAAALERLAYEAAEIRKLLEAKDDKEEEL